MAGQSTVSELLQKLLSRLFSHNLWLFGLLAAFGTTLSAASNTVNLKILTVPLDAVGVMLLAAMTFVNLSRLRTYARVQHLSLLLDDEELENAKLRTQFAPSFLNEFGYTPGSIGIAIDFVCQIVDHATWAAILGIAIRYNRIALSPYSQIGWGLFGCLVLVNIAGRMTDSPSFSPSRPKWFGIAEETVALILIAGALFWAIS